MKADWVSAFTLERYRLGELSPEEQQSITKALAADNNLRSRMENLEKSDRELRLRYPLESLGPDIPGNAGRHSGRLVAGNRIRFFGRIAALVLVCILLPVIYFLRSGPGSTAGQTAGNELQTGNAVSAGPGPSQDRVKGLVSENPKLSIYLKGNQESPLSDQTMLREGSTVQLAYTAPAGEHYGVIFSIDGRSTVTMHYPYGKGQSSLLVSGRHTFLNEAYTLDDAPDYEIFVMVISESSLDTEAILGEARRIAELDARQSGAYGSAALLSIEEKSRSIFTGCEVETAAVLKESGN